MRQDSVMDSVIKQNEGGNLTFVSNTHSASSMFYALQVSISHAYHSQTHHILSCSFSLKDEKKTSEHEFDDCQYSAACLLYLYVAALPVSATYAHSTAITCCGKHTQVQKKLQPHRFYMQHLRESPILNAFLRTFAPLLKDC